MSAKEMFEKLDMYRDDFDDGTIRYTDEHYYTTVHFYEKNNISIHNIDFGTMDKEKFIILYKAINKQVEELGWLND